MATIVELEVRRPKRRDPGPAARGKSADVVIFPGIRYEHWTEGQAAARSTPQREIVRDTLTIGD